MMKHIRIVPVLAMACAVLTMTACAENKPVAQKAEAEADPVTIRPASQSFAQAGDGTVIPDYKPDAEAVAFAQRCSASGGGSVAMGVSECTLVGLKGTPSRFVGGEDQTGRSHDAIWYVEGGVRTVYKFDDDKLVAIIK